MIQVSFLRARDRAFVAILFAIFLGVAALAQTPPKALVRIPVANMFSSASAEADVVSQAIYASEVSVLMSKDGFTQVRTPDSYTGWVRDEDLLLSHTYPGNGAVVQVRSLSANLYREPDVTAHAPLLTVPFETRLEIIPQPEPENRDYFHVRLVDGREAWLDRGDADPSPRPITIAESIELAKRFLGVTYTWGGAPASASIVRGSRRCSSAAAESPCREMPTSRPRGPAWCR